MIFRHRTVYGREFFYPVDKLAAKFVCAFPGSRGMRKCLTKDQYDMLLEIGVYPKIKPCLDYDMSEPLTKPKRKSKNNEKPIHGN